MNYFQAYARYLGIGGSSNPVVINLCDYGINIYQMLATNSFQTAIANEQASDFFSKIPTDGSYFSVIHNDGVNPIINARADVVVNQTGDIGTVSINTAIFNSDMGTVLSINLSIIRFSNNAAAVLTLFHPNYISPFTPNA